MLFENIVQIIRKLLLKYNDVILIGPYCAWRYNISMLKAIQHIKKNLNPVTIF